MSDDANTTIVVPWDDGVSPIIGNAGQPFSPYEPIPVWSVVHWRPVSTLAEWVRDGGSMRGRR